MSSQHFEGAARVALRNDGAFVAKDNAKLTVAQSFLGDTLAQQERGEVFYRAPKNKAFKVQTPLGIVESLGTSFSVEIIPAKIIERGLKASGEQAMLSSKGLSKRDVIVGAAAAALSAVLVVTVYEGSVKVSSDANAQVVEPGQRAQVSQRVARKILW